MDMNVEGKKIRIPKNVTLEYMLKLDPQALKNLCHTNKEYYAFCRRSNVWKIMLRRDFPNDSIPHDLNDPDWMKIYFEFHKKNKKVLVSINAETQKGQGVFQNEIMKLSEATAIKRFIDENEEIINDGVSIYITDFDSDIPYDQIEIKIIEDPTIVKAFELITTSIQTSMYDLLDDIKQTMRDYEINA